MADDSYGGYIGSLLFWLFLPPILAQFVLGAYYGLFTNKAQRPAKGSKAYEKHFKIAYTIVVVGYFSYCMGDFVFSLRPTYYDIIGVPRLEVDESLKKHFKHTIIALHPDKNPSADPSEFMRLKTVYEALSNEPTRVAYDCYGPDVVKTVAASSTKSATRSVLGEYFMQAFYEWIGFYAGTFLFFLLSFGIGSRQGLYWRAVGLAASASLDLYVICRPMTFGVAGELHAPFGRVPIAGHIMRLLLNIPTHRKLAILRRAYTYSSIGFGQIASLRKQVSAEEQIKDLSVKLDALTKSPLTREADFQLASTMEPVSQNEAMRQLLEQKMGQLAAELRLFDSLGAADRRRLVLRKSSPR